MRYEEAYDLVLKEYPEYKSFDNTVRIYRDYYIFTIVPKDYNREKDGLPINSDIGVNIKTREVAPFQPMAHEGYFDEVKKDTFSSVLTHYGVLGMRWGVRHDYPPGSGHYPDGNVSSGSKKAKSREYEIKSRKKAEGNTDSKSKMKKDFHLTRNQKIALAIGVGVAGTVAGAVVVSKLRGQNLALGKNLVGNVISGASGELQRGAPVSIKDALTNVNKLDGKWVKEVVSATGDKIRMSLDKGRQNNCMFCTTAFDLQRRGYEMVEAGRAHFGGSTKSIYEWYDNVVVHTLQSSDVADKPLLDVVTNALTNNGTIQNARGNLMVTWKSGGGHSMAYEIIDGKLHICDAQIGYEYSTQQDLINLFSKVDFDFDLATEFSWARLDTATPKMDFLIDNGIIKVPGRKAVNKKSIMQTFKTAFTTKDIFNANVSNDFVNEFNRKIVSRDSDGYAVVENVINNPHGYSLTEIQRYFSNFMEGAEIINNAAAAGSIGLPITIGMLSSASDARRRRKANRRKKTKR